MTSLLTPLVDGVEGIEGRCVCREVHRVTHDVTSFVLEPEQPGTPEFEPGQYLTVSVDVGGRRLSRCYSIASSPARRPLLTITVKRVPGGPVSTWLHDHLHPGGRLEVSGPLGSFGATRDPRAGHLYLSAGSGITPLMSMARTLVDRGAAADVVFVHHARTPADIIFRDELERMGDVHPGIRTVVVCEDDAPHEAWSGRRGRLDAALLADVVPDVADREAFVCGPPPYRESARRLLLDAGTDPARVHEESYVFETPAPTSAPAAPGADRSVQLRRSGRTLACSPGTTLLTAVEQAGLSVPTSCREGICGTCITPLLEGTVDMNHAGGIRPRQVEQGQVLLCCSTPTSDVVLDA